LYHIESKTCLPKDLFLQDQIRQLLKMQPNHVDLFASPLSLKLPKIQSPAKIQQANKGALVHPTEPEYIDIAEYEKLFAVLQEAAGA
jgi:hypothetical protein